MSIEETDGLHLRARNELTQSVDTLREALDEFTHEFLCAQVDLRDRIAMVALEGILASHPRQDALPDRVRTAKQAYEYADAMIAARQEPSP